MVPLIVGINHKTAPVAIREQVAFSPNKLAGALAEFVDRVSVKEVVILSTC
ncbi:MAG TPA: glutamyl-tRNA reductase, partial [Gammaproteobacteria bacterium]|nr:glutamyl-tRNA reductase [Gammaproteobacteria bacterium]